MPADKKGVKNMVIHTVFLPLHAHKLFPYIGSPVL